MSNDIHIIQLNSYIRPKLTENKSKGWVMNGKNNEFYQYIIDRYNGSPTNAAIINSYVDLIYGRGLYAKNAVTNLSDWTKLKTALKSKDIRQVIADFVIFGEFSFQVIETKGKELSSILHIPKERVIPSIADEKEVIQTYWYSRDWQEQFKPENKPVEYPSFNGQKQKDCIYVAKPYKAGKEYFSDPDYLAGMPYAEMEEEIANLYVNSIKQGLSAGYIINVPNGKNWEPEQKKKFKKKIEEKLKGSPNASNFIVSFNGENFEVTITPIPVNDSVHKQWEYLTSEARQQLLTAHRVTSPMLFGIKDSTGLGNNADELDTAEAQLMKRVIAPKQSFILDAITEVLSLYEINLDLTFLPLTEEKEVAENVALSAQFIKPPEGLAEQLISLGEDIDNKEWDILSVADVDYNTDDDLYDIIQFASTGVARPNAKSAQDSNDIKIRYRYVDQNGKTGAKGATGEREFCKKMLSANKLYRKEDILQMGEKTVNGGFGKAPNPNQPYSIWLWKGGGKITEKYPNGTCKHKWQREIYLNRGGSVDVNSPLAKTISTSEARRKGYRVPTNKSDVSVTPNKNR